MQWSDIPKNPSKRMLRQFGGLCVVFFGGLALYGAVSKGHVTGPLCLGLIAFLAGLLAVTRPALLKGIFIGWMILAFPIGFVVSKLILLSVFLLVFTPVSLIFRVIGRDALILKKRTGTQATYWLPKVQPTDPGRYLKQY